MISAAAAGGKGWPAESTDSAGRQANCDGCTTVPDGQSNWIRSTAALGTGSVVLAVTSVRARSSTVFPLLSVSDAMNR